MRREVLLMVTDVTVSLWPGQGLGLILICNSHLSQNTYMTKQPIPYIAFSTSRLTENQSALLSANS